MTPAPSHPQPPSEPDLPDTAGRQRLARIRHDLRTPINHIIGYSEILIEDAADRVPAQFLTDLERMRSGGHQLLALVNRCFGETALSSGALDPHRLGHDLRTTVNHIIGYGELLADQCDDLGQDRLKPDLGRVVAAARTWLQLMEEQLAQAGSPATHPIPDRQPASQPEPPLDPLDFAARPLDSAAAPATAPGSVLVADDDALNRDLMQRRLEKFGYKVTVCADGPAAWRLLGQASFDVAILDLLMPGLDGRELLERIRNDPVLQHLPILVMSALDQMDGIVRCIELGAEDYLAKPLNPVLLRARVAAALEKKRLRDHERIYLHRIEEERAKSDRLLLNILPRAVADRLKQGEGSIVDSYEDVTVLFGDLVGFTPFSAQIPPARVVRLLDEIFTAFDALAAEHGLEKIKTIGDAYMAVAGLPCPRNDHAAAAARMALHMLERLDQFNRRHATAMRMRVGLSTGPVIAGIIGRSKFIYDLWGDTVNTASRMESQGMPGRIQVAAPTYERLRGLFRFEDRGDTEVRGKGTLKTYWLVAE